MNQPSNRRRRFWINTDFQGRYLRMVLLLQLVTLAVTALVAFALAFALMNPRFQAGPSWNGIFGVFIGMAGMLAVALGWLGVRVSHRICGPVHNIRRNLGEIRAGGTPQPIRLRQRDEFKDLADEINATIDYLRRPR